MLDVALLGCGGMMPLPGRYLTSLFLRLNGRYALIDCGEGTQVTLKSLGWGFKNIDMILITHFHADHIAGLPGLLLTIGNSGRTEPIVMIGPVGLKNVVNSLLVIAPELNFPIMFREMETNDSFTVGDFHVNSIVLDHRIKCFGYSVEVKRKGKFDSKKANELELPKKYWSNLQNNEEVLYNEKLFTPSMVLGDERKGIKLSYSTDTRPVKGIYEFVKDSDLFICEGIYGDNEKKHKAIEYKHMLFSEAAEIAKNSGVKELWLTHYSPSLTNPEEYLSVATDIFENTQLGYDRKTTTLFFED